MRKNPSRPAPELVRRLGAVGLSEYLITELLEDRVDLARVAAVLEYGQDAARPDTPAARRRELDEARKVLRQLKMALARAHRWYRATWSTSRADKARPSASGGPSTGPLENCASRLRVG